MSENQQLLKDLIGGWGQIKEQTIVYIFKVFFVMSPYDGANTLSGVPQSSVVFVQLGGEPVQRPCCAGTNISQYS